MKKRLESQGVYNNDDFSAEDLKDLFNVIKGQKEGLFALQDSI
jgi:hypothetical protein